MATHADQKAKRLVVCNAMPTIELESSSKKKYKRKRRHSDEPTRPNHDIQSKEQWTHLLVRTHPAVSDRRELFTIVTFSLRELFGECQPYGLFEVVESRGRQSVIKCNVDCVPFVRGALTFCTPPPYMQDTTFQFDVLQIDTDPKLLHST